MNAIRVDLNAAECSCCHYNFVRGDRVVVHVGRGEEHLFHFKCLQNLANGFFLTHCPRCNANLDTDLVLTRTDRCITTLQWAKRGAVIGGIFVLAANLLFSLPENPRAALHVACNGALLGAAIGGLFRLQSHCVSKIYNAFYRDPRSQVLTM